MKRIGLALIGFYAAALLSACGGGSSNSGAGTDKAATSFAGQYFGFETLYLSAPNGVVMLIGRYPLSISIAPDGSVLVTNADGMVFQGQMGAPLPNQPLPQNGFVATGPFPLPPTPDLVCQPALYAYFGTVAGNIINGNTNASFNCVTRGVPFVFRSSGPFQATKGAPGFIPGPGPTRPMPGPGERRRSEGQLQKAIIESLEHL